MSESSPEPSEHPLLTVLVAAASGRFPDVDGRVEFLPPDHRGTCGVAEFTGHSFVLTDQDPARLEPFRLDGFGRATQPGALIALAGHGATVGSLDVVLVRRGAGPHDESRRLDRVDDTIHPRVRRAQQHRSDVRVLGDARGIVCVGIGLVGRIEMSVQLTGAPLGAGAGRDLVMAALDEFDADELVFAQVAPGNAASLRAFLACGFVPIGSEVLIEPIRR